MSAHTKTHPTNSFNVRFSDKSYSFTNLSKKNTKRFSRLLSDFATSLPQDKVEIKEEGTPWREAFSDTLNALKGNTKYKEAAITLKGARLAASLSQVNLAKQINVQQSYVSKMENAMIPIGKVMAHRLGKALGRDPRLFLTGF
jgi:ribosome-binding protein aMBF1 (putative translation factor)